MWIMLNNLQQAHLKRVKKVPSTAAATSDLIGNKTANKIARTPKTSP